MVNFPAERDFTGNLRIFLAFSGSQTIKNREFCAFRVPKFSALSSREFQKRSMELLLGVQCIPLAQKQKCGIPFLVSACEDLSKLGSPQASSAHPSTLMTVLSPKAVLDLPGSVPLITGKNRAPASGRFALAHSRIFPPRSVHS
jgi:hypothetical protein